MNSLKKFFLESFIEDPYPDRPTVRPTPSPAPSKPKLISYTLGCNGEVLDALKKIIEIPEGLTRFTLTMNVDEVTTINCTYYPRKKSTEDSHEQRPESNIGQDPGNP